MRVTLEVAKSITVDINQTPEGVIIKLENDHIIFVSGSTIGVFSLSEIENINGDFLRIPTHTLVSIDDNKVLDPLLEQSIN